MGHNEISLSDLTVDMEVQGRAQLNWVTASEYADAMRAGAVFPPIVVFDDGTDKWLSSGFHRVEAAKQAGIDIVAVDMRPGTRRDAILFSLGENATHGLPRTRADKEKAVLTMLHDDEWKHWSDREIARQCKVSHPFVIKQRKILTGNVTSEDLQPRTYITKHGTTATMNTVNIGNGKDNADDAFLYERAQYMQAKESGELLPDGQRGVNRHNGELSNGIAIGENEKTKPHVANNSGNNEWYTPASIINAARETMGSIDLDPASSDIANQTVRAERYYTADDNGLVHEWFGNVWMNPPYAQPLMAEFAAKMKHEVQNGNVIQACTLVNNATETRWFCDLVDASLSICFLTSRVKFLTSDGERGAPLQGQAVLYYGDNTDGFFENFSGMGFIVEVCR